MRIVLHWKEENNTEGTRTCDLPVTIGRNIANDVSIQHSALSAYHARLFERDGKIWVEDLNSRNGTFVLAVDRKVERGSKSVLNRNRFWLADILFQIEYTSKNQSKNEDIPSVEDVIKFASKSIGQKENGDSIYEELSRPIILDEITDESRQYYEPNSVHEWWQTGLLAKQVITISDLRTVPMPWKSIKEIPYLAIGGGIGSFIWVDNLRVYGVPIKKILAIGIDEKPYSRYKRLCEAHQLHADERIRSDSSSMPDNLWGWPGYALREMFNEFRQGDLGKVFKLCWQIFTEPSLSDVYSPYSRDVYRYIDAECDRIGWYDIFQNGRVRLIRKTDDGRYLVLYSRGGEFHAVVARYIQISTGYPGIELTRALRQYREETKDRSTVVNGYENHEHIYQRLAQQGGNVIIQGRGIVASRILQKIDEVRRASNKEIRVYHVMRSFVKIGNKSPVGGATRPTAHGVEMQPFNWPKACWGGGYRVALENASKEVRGQLLKSWGGTSIPHRTDWLNIIEQGKNKWYFIVKGIIVKVQKQPSQFIDVYIEKIGKEFSPSQVLLQNINFIIDCTGLDANIKTQPLLRDLIEQYKIDLTGDPSKAQRLAVEPNFELRNLRNDKGRVFAVGTITLGSYYAPVDSFLGLHYSAQRIIYTLINLGSPHLKHLGPIRSFGQWWRWARGKSP